MSRGIGFSNVGLAVAATLMLTGTAERYRRSLDAPPTPEQIAADEKRTERQRWNDEVEARKAAKKSKGQP